MSATVIRKNAVVITDGSCFGNPGVGGYASIIKVEGSYKKTIAGCVVQMTTNNRMELMAVVEAIKQLNLDNVNSLRIEVRTDSQYLITCSAHKDLQWYRDHANADMWIQLIDECNKGKHVIRFVKVKGHSGDEDNETCDKLAKEYCGKAQAHLRKAMASNGLIQVVGE